MFKKQFLRKFIDASLGERVTFLTSSGLVLGVPVSGEDTSDALEFVREFLSTRDKDPENGFITLRDATVVQDSKTVELETFVLFIDQIVGVSL